MATTAGPSDTSIEFSGTLTVPASQIALVSQAQTSGALGALLESVTMAAYLQLEQMADELGLVEYVCDVAVNAVGGMTATCTPDPQS